jgi:arsenate reductase-like glutaredoxin family protein
MNHKILELVKQAGGHFSTHNLMSNPVQQREFIELWDDRIEKFAELIVKECASYVDEAISEGGVDGRGLKEHFGVES